jgi:hypothetical protein
MYERTTKIMILEATLDYLFNLGSFSVCLTYNDNMETRPSFRFGNSDVTNASNGCGVPAADVT